MRPLRDTSAPLAALVAALVAVAGCAGSGTTRTGPATGPASSTTAARGGLPSFYLLPAESRRGPGTLIKQERVAAPGIHGPVDRVMYVSENAAGGLVMVTGLVFVPQRPAPAGGYPVLSWGHGTNGMATQCAPSLDLMTAVPQTNELLDQGWEVAASDYLGEGTPGPLPYLVGVLAARNTIDVVRAVRHLAEAHPSRSYAVWGHSEGGQTAMLALHIAPTYAPDLHLLGVVAGAPPSQFNLIYQFLRTSPFRFYLLMAAEGFNRAYGDQAAPLDQVLTPPGISLLPELAKGCFDYVQKTIDQYSLDQLAKVDPFTVPAWKQLLMANDPESFTSANRAPLLIAQGGDDEQIPVASTAILANHLSVGQGVERWIYPGKDHAGVIDTYTLDMVHWSMTGSPAKPVRTR
jgi:alpha-beta hydrolase superfamily lysophospholipase